MNKYLAILSFAFFVGCTPSESKVNLIDKTEKTFENGSPEVVTQYVKENDELVPYSRVQYHNNGEIYFTGRINKKGNRKGLWKSFYPSGKPWSEGEFIDGKRNGKCTVWFESGQIRYEGKYKDNKKVGPWKFWDDEGNLAQEIEY